MTSRSELWSIVRIVDAWASCCTWRHIVQTFNMVWEVLSQGTVGTDNERSEAEEDGRASMRVRRRWKVSSSRTRRTVHVVQVMVDANWADDAIGWRSTPDGVLSLYGCAIGLGVSPVWRCARQKASCTFWDRVQLRLWGSPRLLEE